MEYGKPIRDLNDLMQAAKNKRAVYCPQSNCFTKPTPAAFMMNQQGHILYGLFQNGMYLFSPTPKARFDQRVTHKEKGE